MEGEVVRIVTRAVTQVVGVFQNHEAYGFVRRMTSGSTGIFLFRSMRLTEPLMA